MDSFNETNIDIKIPAPELLPSSFLISRRGKIPSLINGSFTTPQSLRGHQNHRIDFNAPIFIDHVSVYTGSVGSLSNLEISAVDISGKEIKNSPYMEKDTDRTIFEIKCFTDNIQLKKSSLFSNEKIQRIEIFFHTIEKLSEICKVYTDFWIEFDEKNNDLKNYRLKLEEEADNIKGERADLEAYKSEQEENLSSIKSEIEVSEPKLAELKEELGKTTALLNERSISLEDARKKEAIAENNLTQLKKQSADLNNDISGLNKELMQLKRNKNLYAEDMENYVGESQKQLIFYYILTLGCTAIISFIAFLSVGNLEGLIEEFIWASKANPSISALDFFIIRAPYTSVCITIVGALISLIVSLVNRIFIIHGQKREIISLSVLARDISEASRHQLEDLDDEVVYKLREESKFRLLSQSIVGSSFNAALPPISLSKQGKDTASSTD